MVKIDTAALVTKPAKRAEKPIKCGFCSNRQSCEQCPGAVRGMDRGPAGKVWVCSCQCGGGETLRCLECKSNTPGEVNPVTWSCFDKNACESRRKARLAANPAYQIMDQIEEKTKMVRAAKTAEKPARAPSAPKSGVCLVTGEPTKGGLFKPGMDARYVSERVAEVLAKEVGVVAQRKRLKADGVSDALQAKFEKSLTLAQEKAAKEKAEGGAPAAKKAAASKPKETAAAKRKRLAAEAAAAEDDEEDEDEDDEEDEEDEDESGF